MDHSRGWDSIEPSRYPGQSVLAYKSVVIFPAEVQQDQDFDMCSISRNLLGSTISKPQPIKPPSEVPSWPQPCCARIHPTPPPSASATSAAETCLNKQRRRLRASQA